MQRFYDGTSMASSIRPPYTMWDVWTNEVARSLMHEEPTKTASETDAVGNGGGEWI